MQSRAVAGHPGCLGRQCSMRGCRGSRHARPPSPPISSSRSAGQGEKACQVSMAPSSPMVWVRQPGWPGLIQPTYPTCTGQSTGRGRMARQDAMPAEGAACVAVRECGAAGVGPSSAAQEAGGLAASQGLHLLPTGSQQQKRSLLAVRSRFSFLLLLQEACPCALCQGLRVDPPCMPRPPAQPIPPPTEKSNKVPHALRPTPPPHPT